LYATGLFLLLLWVYGLWTLDNRTGQVEPQQLTALAEVFFAVYAVTQFVAVILLTPGYVAGCIADDKERRTIEFLLATDLANREIIFGKMIARIGNLMLFLITGLPVLSLIQFFGGIDPAILLLSFAATGLTMLGLIGISMIQSVQRKRVRDATSACANCYGFCKRLPAKPAERLLNP
jgi:ABC-type transport system involved in multi-copper enzyme maturation permease subunit